MRNPQNILVTGGSGFIGSAFIRYMFRLPEFKGKVVNLDLLTYAGNPENVSGAVDEARYVFERGDIGNSELVTSLCERHAIDAIVNFAAESHVDRSILGPAEFVRCIAVATVVAFILEDLLILSQHSHVPMNVSGGAHVTPHTAMDQERFTRSLRLPGAISRAVLHFDAHELHHMYPFVPGYRLRHIAYEPHNEIGWRQWVMSARRIPGDVLLFQNRRDTGLTL